MGFLFFPFHSLSFGSGWLRSLHPQPVCACGGGRLRQDIKLHVLEHGVFIYVVWNSSVRISHLIFFCVLTNSFILALDLRILILYFGL